MGMLKRKGCGAIWRLLVFVHVHSSCLKKSLTRVEFLVVACYCCRLHGCPDIFFLLFAFVEHHSAGVRGRQGGEHEVFKNRAKREKRGGNWDICLPAMHGRGLNNGGGGRTRRTGTFRVPWDGYYWVSLCDCTLKPTATMMMLVIITK